MANFITSLQNALANWASKPQNQGAVQNLLKLQKPAQQVKQFLVNPPTTQFAQPIVNQIQNPILKTVASVPLNMAQGIINSPQQYVSGITKTGLNIGDILQGKKVRPQDVLGNVAQTGEGILNLSMIPGLGSLGESALEEAAAPAVKQTLADILKQGAVSGGKYGLAFGGLSGLQKYSQAPTVKEQLLSTAKTLPANVGMGALLGAGIGGTTYGVSKLLSKIGQPSFQTDVTDALKSGEIKPAEAALLLNKGKELTPVEPPVEGGVRGTPKVTQTIPQTGNPETDLQNVLDSAGNARNRQAAINTAETGQKIAAFKKVGETTSGEAGAYAQLGAMKGPMEKVQFDEIKSKLSQDTINGLFDKKNQLTDPFEQVTYINGLSDLMSGRVPTESRLAVLGKVLKPETVQAILDKRSFFEKATKEGAEILNLPRALMATADLSAPLRQGIFLIGRPKQWIPAFRDMFKYAFSEKAYQGLEADLASRPNAKLYKSTDLAITTVGGTLEKREEAFMSNLAEKIPIFGKLARGSNRAYTGFLNKLRADTFDDMYKSASDLGVVAERPQVVNDIANFVNTATGRGNLGQFSGQAKAMANVFFSPRLMASRINLLNPVYYMKLDPFVRKEALKSLVTFVGTGLTVLELSHLAGAQVGTDARSADFGKIKIGNTRLDIWGGFTQYIRPIAQIITGEYVNSQTGKVSKIAGFGRNTNVYGAKTVKDMLSQFAENKANPVVSFALGLMTGTNPVGQPFNPPAQIASMFIPMVVQDMYDIYKNGGLKDTALGVPGIFGVGTQTYGKQVPQLSTTTAGNPKLQMVNTPGMAEDLTSGIMNWFNKSKAQTPTTIAPTVTPVTQSMNVTDILKNQKAETDKTTLYKDTMTSNMTDQQKVQTLTQAGFTQQDIKDQEMKVLKSADLTTKIDFIKQQISAGTTDFTTLYKNGVLTSTTAQELERQGYIPNADALMKNMKLTDVYQQHKTMRSLLNKKIKKVKMPKSKVYKYKAPKMPKIKKIKVPKFKSYKLPKIKVG